MNRVVLDASALLAVIHREAGAERVVSQLRGSVMSAVNYSEVLKKLVDRGTASEAARRQIDYLHVTIRPFDTEQAISAAAIWPLVKDFGLSLGDRACLALGITLGAAVLTADQQMARPKLPVEVNVIRAHQWKIES